MTTLTINGLAVSAIIAQGQEPKGTRREVGDTVEAADGSLRVTRQVRRRGLSFRTIPLVDSDAYAWECLFVGEGETWSFDQIMYGSKGLGPTVATSCSIIVGSTKFGNGKLRVGATTGNFQLPLSALQNLAGSGSAWTISVWQFASAAWHNYIVTSAGKKWVDGVRNDAAVTTWLSVGSSVQILNTSGASVDYDDLVILPYLVPDSWPPVLGVATSAFSLLPFLTAAGAMVPEASTRSVLGQVTESLVKSAGGVRHRLDVELKPA